MAVLAEAISVVIRADRLLAAWGGNWDAFRKSVPNNTVCADDELVRVGFMTPDDVAAYIADLGTRGLVHVKDGRSVDMVVVDQLRGPTTPCDWIEFGHVSLDNDPRKRISACKMRGSTWKVVVMPEGWRFANSLSSHYGFVPSEHVDKSLRYLRHEDGLDVYFNELTGKEVFVGRTTRGQGP